MITDKKLIWEDWEKYRGFLRSTVDVDWSDDDTTRRLIASDRIMMYCVPKELQDKWTPFYDMLYEI